jgi:hypothetical protein
MRSLYWLPFVISAPKGLQNSGLQVAEGDLIEHPGSIFHLQIKAQYKSLLPIMVVFF